MHELSLAQEIVHMVEATAQREHFHRVATLRLEAGALSGVEVASLRFALDAMVSGTCLEGACIEIEEPPGAAWCASCQREVTILTRADPCPVCNGYPVKPMAGLALRVLDLVVVDD